MTEAEFLASTDPSRMLEWLTAERVRPDGTAAGRRPINGSDFQVSDRRLRLWACACWRACPPRNLVTGWLDALLELEEIADAHRQNFSWPSKGYICATASIAELRQLSGLWLGENLSEQQRHSNAQVCCAILRTIVGNPFRSASLCGNRDHGSVVVRPYCPACRRILTHADGRVPKLASVIYDERRWELMPMLADALEESGCRDEDTIRWCMGQERCPTCLGEGELRAGSSAGIVYSQCGRCVGPDGYGTGWIPRRGPSVRGDWCIDLLLGKE